MRAYFPGGTLNALASSPKRLTPPATSVHRLRLGLPGYLILFAPLALSLSASIGPGDRLRYWCSSRYLRIPPLHLEFHHPLPYSRTTVLRADHGLSPCIKLLTYNPAYTPFTPSNSEQRLHPTYYRGCWHVVSRCLLRWYRHTIAGFSSHLTEVYNPRTFILHAALLRQAFAHCAKFPTAASRRSLGRISVPMWPFTLSGRLPIVALVGRYPTNKLMGRKLISKRFASLITKICIFMITSGISPALARLSQI